MRIRGQIFKDNNTCVCMWGKKSHQVYEHTHVLFGQPVEQSCWIRGKDLIILEGGDGLDTLLELLQTWLHTLYLNPTYR